MEITSRDNNIIKYYCKLAADKKFRREHKVFCIEGLRLILDAFSSGIIPEKLFVTDNCLQKYNEKLGNIIKTCDIIIVSEHVAQKMSEVKTPQGLFAIVKTLDKIADADKMIRIGGSYVGICSVQDPGNLGTMIRTADAFRIDGIILYDTCDIYSPKTVRSTMGSLFRIPILQCLDISSLLKQINSFGGKTYASVVDGEAIPLTDCDFSGLSLLLIGNEANGLPETIIKDCTCSLTIPMKGNAESLNAAAAASVCMWEMTRRR